MSVQVFGGNTSIFPPGKPLPKNPSLVLSKNTFTPMFQHQANRFGLLAHILNAVSVRQNWTLPQLVDTRIREYYNSKEKKMGKKMKERRVYTKEFKAEAAALAEKREKPVRQVA
jgi:hypothetical protein